MPGRTTRKRSARQAVVEDDEDNSPSKRSATLDEGEENEGAVVTEEDVVPKEESTEPDENEGDEGEDEEHAEGNNEEDEIMDDEAGEPNSPSGSHGNEEENEEMEEEEGEEAAEEAEEEIQTPKSPRKRINAAGKSAEAGVIKTIYCENFMCHAKLKVELCRNVNFIHGQNGSGKSAILAAIQICLGSNARRTHRASNVKDLVRKEAAGNNPNTSAKVRVTLLNGGDDGYKQDLYGERITVERCISLRSGYNGYKLYDQDMNEVSRNKKDLEEMLDHLNIQVDNPVAILGQEDAKQFLKGKASDKVRITNNRSDLLYFKYPWKYSHASTFFSFYQYSFFLKATELSRLSNTFCQIQERTEELHAKRESLASDLEKKRENVLKWYNALKEFTHLEDLQKKRLGHEVDYGWAFFAERDEEYQQDLQVRIATAYPLFPFMSCKEKETSVLTGIRRFFSSFI